MLLTSCHHLEHFKMGTFTILLVLLVPAVLSQAIGPYGWNDYYYNQEILDQLDDYFHPWLYDEEGDRVRKIPRFRSRICCGHYDEETLEKEDRIREQCHIRVFGQWRFRDYEEGWNPFIKESTAEVKEKIKCVHQCLWRLRGALDDRSRRRENEIHEYYHRRNGKETWRREISDRAVNKCLPLYELDQYPRPRRGQCSPAHLSFSYCVWKEFHQHCPDRYWNSGSQYCRRVRRYLTRA